jgi:hypothetical protein
MYHSVEDKKIRKSKTKNPQIDASYKVPLGDVFSGNVTVVMHVVFCCNLYGQAAQAKDNLCPIP